MHLRTTVATVSVFGRGIFHRQLNKITFITTPVIVCTCNVEGVQPLVSVCARSVSAFITVTDLHVLHLHCVGGYLSLSFPSTSPSLCFSPRVCQTGLLNTTPPSLPTRLLPSPVCLPHAFIASLHLFLPCCLSLSFPPSCCLLWTSLSATVFACVSYVLQCVHTRVSLQILCVCVCVCVCAGGANSSLLICILLILSWAGNDKQQRPECHCSTQLQAACWRQASAHTHTHTHTQHKHTNTHTLACAD